MTLANQHCIVRVNAVVLRKRRRAAPVGRHGGRTNASRSAAGQSPARSSKRSSELTAVIANRRCRSRSWVRIQGRPQRSQLWSLCADLPEEPHELPRSRQPWLNLQLCSGHGIPLGGLGHLHSLLAQYGPSASSQPVSQSLSAATSEWNPILILRSCGLPSSPEPRFQVFGVSHPRRYARGGCRSRTGVAGWIPVVPVRFRAREGRSPRKQDRLP